MKLAFWNNEGPLPKIVLFVENCSECRADSALALLADGIVPLFVDVGVLPIGADAIIFNSPLPANDSSGETIVDPELLQKKSHYSMSFRLQMRLVDTRHVNQRKGPQRRRHT